MIEINKEQLLSLSDKNKTKILKYISLGIIKYIEVKNEISRINW